MLRPVLAACALLCGAGCAFEPSGLVGGDGRAPADGGRGADGGGPAADAAPCPAPVVAALEVNGAPAPDDPMSPALTALLGDTIAFDSDGSCVKAGPLQLAWTLSPADGTLATVVPSLTAPSITLYPLQPVEYTVTLTVTDGRGVSATQKARFSVRGFESLAPAAALEIRDLAPGGGSLWIATKTGPYSMALSLPGVYVDVDTIFGGADPAPDLASVAWDAQAGHAWFGAKTMGPEAWRVRPPPAATIDAVPFDGAGALGGNAAAFDFVDLSDGVRLATSRGTADAAADSTTFANPWAPPNGGPEIRALALAGARHWAGGAALWDQAAVTPLPLYPFGGTADQKIRALAFDGIHGELWVTGDLGIARLDAQTGQTIATFSGTGAGLPSNNVRDVAVETAGPFAGDAWFATQAGIVRYKRDRHVLVPMQEAQGLTLSLDLSAVCAIWDGAARARAIYAGSNKGLMYIHVP